MTIQLRVYKIPEGDDYGRVKREVLGQGRRFLRGPVPLTTFFWGL